MTEEQPKTYYLPIYALTGIFGAMFAFGPLFVRKGPNRGITRCCIMLAAFCLWIFWVTMYIGQMNPLMGPRLPNTTLAWLGYKWGIDPKTIEPPDSTATTTTPAATTEHTEPDGDAL